MFVYADHAATAPLSPAARAAMEPFLSQNYGNASSVYALAREAARALLKARQEMAAALGCLPEEVYFTSGGTEADNWALKGVFEAKAPKGKHIVSSAIEHHAVLHTLKYLEKHGAEVTFLPVNEDGVIALSDLEKALRPDTIAVSLMAANNEVGSLQPIAEAARLAHAHGALFHTDAVQAVGHIPLDFAALDADMLSLSAHNCGGPTGVGALIMRKGLRLPPLLHGGGHERGQRSGTENVAGVVGMTAALCEAVAALDAREKHMKALQNKVVSGVMQIPYSYFSGHKTARLPGLCSFVFESVEGESLVLGLDNAGVCASSGSACSSGSLDPSHVLLAMGMPHEVAHGSLRLSLGHENTAEEAEYLVKTVAEVVAARWAMSPLWDEQAQKPTMRFWDK